jgi:hypothetical protein
MAYFLGEVEGARGKAIRLGTQQSGLSATLASPSGSVRVVLWHDSKTGRDMATVALVEWKGRGVSRILYEGPVGTWLTL